MTDEKLNMCSWATQGIYIKIMCVLHKQNEYGRILFKQNPKQNSSKEINRVNYFASILIRQIPCTLEDMIFALEELTEFEVLRIDDDGLSQKRMVRDGQISDARSAAGKKGGGNPVLFKQKSKQRDKQRDKQITEYENEYEYNNNKGIVLENLTPVDEAIGPELSECKKIVESDQIWVEAFCMNNRITIPQFKTFLTDFFKKLQDEGETRKTPKDAKRHFANWVKIQNKASNGTEQPKKTFRRFSDTAPTQR